MLVLIDTWQFLYHTLFTGTWVVGLIMIVLRLAGKTDLARSSDFVRSTNLLLFIGGVVHALFLLVGAAVLGWMSLQTGRAPLEQYAQTLTWVLFLDLPVFVILPLAAIHPRLRRWPLLPVVAMITWSIVIVFVRDVRVYDRDLQAFGVKALEYPGRILLYALFQVVVLWLLRRKRDGELQHVAQGPAARRP